MKRKANLTGIRFKYLFSGKGKIKLTQTNNKETCFNDFNDNHFDDTVNQVESILNEIKSIKEFHLMVDNTQSNYYYFVIKIDVTFPIPNLISIIKKMKTNGRL